MDGPRLKQEIVHVMKCHNIAMEIEAHMTGDGPYMEFHIGKFRHRIFCDFNLSEQRRFRILHRVYSPYGRGVVNVSHHGEWRYSIVEVAFDIGDELRSMFGDMLAIQLKV